MPPIHKLPECVAANIKFLMDLHNWDQKTLAKKAGISQKTISNMVNPDKGINTQIDNLEKVSNAFKISTWHLMFPYLTREMIEKSQLEHLAEMYSQMDSESRETLYRIAERELAYNAK